MRTEIYEDNTDRKIRNWSSTSLVMRGKMWKLTKSAVGTLSVYSIFTFLNTVAHTITYFACLSLQLGGSRRCIQTCLATLKHFQEQEGFFFWRDDRKRKTLARYLKTWWSQIKIRQLFPPYIPHFAYLSLFHQNVHSSPLNLFLRSSSHLPLTGASYPISLFSQVQLLIVHLFPSYITLLRSLSVCTLI